MLNIAGYDYGKVSESPFTESDLQLLKSSLLFSEEDEKYLNQAGEILKNQIDDILDLWYNFVGSQPHLVRYFSKNGVANTDYLSAVRGRFGQWILDLCTRKFDKEWLDYQYEIGLRHYKEKKNKTDGVDTEPFVHYRYMIAFIVPITLTIKEFLQKGESNPELVEKMLFAWFKAVTLSVIFWTHPYVKPDEF